MAYGGRCIGTFHGSWLQLWVSFLSKQNAGCTKHIFGVGQGAPKGVSTAARVGHDVVRVPRRALEIQPYRGAGQCVDSKLRAHLSPPMCLLARAGEAVRDVLVMARLDARAAVA